MSDIDYTIAHKNAVPEYLSERWGSPGQLGQDHLLYRGQCEATECAYTASHIELDDEAAIAAADALVLTEVLAMMATVDHGPIVLCKKHINAVQREFSPGEVV